MKNFKELQAKMSPDRRARNEATAAKTAARQPGGLLENGTARRYVHHDARRSDKAMGGRLEIRAVFPNGVVYQPASGSEEARVGYLRRA
jgi:hypothetical protein